MSMPFIFISQNEFKLLLKFKKHTFFSDADYNEDAFSTLWFFWIMHNDIILFKCIFVIEVAVLVVLFFLKKK